MTTLKVYPTPEECKIKNLVKCSEDGCTAVFMCESNLTMHLLMTHGKNTPNKPPHTSIIPKEYYCPDEKCIYHEKKHMKNLKSLRQHYLKVHAEKEFVCMTCKKVFSSLGMLKRHADFCGISFDCCECQVKYNCYETLRTHCRRKLHHIHDKNLYKRGYVDSRYLWQTQVDTAVDAKLCRMLPCQNRSISTDTERGIKPKLKSKMTQVQRTIVIIPQYTKFTQTGNRTTVETQTLRDAPLNKLVKKNSNTQTDVVELQSTGCNTSFIIDDSNDGIEIKEKNSSGTQTSCENQTIFSASTATHYSIHTDTSDLIMEDNLSNLDPFFNCNTETQTDFEMLQDNMSFGDILNGLGLTDNQTQTVFDPLNIGTEKYDIFGLTDNQTQTVFDDLWRSVESQTTMSHVKKTSASYTSTMETQTDNEFREMLEIINS